jgi:hypothetical protein
MAKSIVNLTLLVVVMRLNHALKSPYSDPYLQLFSDFDLRQELIAYVLSRVRNLYIAVDKEESQIEIDSEIMLELTEMKSQIEESIQQGIHHILSKYKII